MYVCACVRLRACVRVCACEGGDTHTNLLQGTVAVLFELGIPAVGVGQVDGTGEEVELVIELPHAQRPQASHPCAIGGRGSGLGLRVTTALDSGLRAEG